MTRSKLTSIGRWCREVSDPLAAALSRETPGDSQILDLPCPSLTPEAVLDEITQFWGTLTPWSLRIVRDGRVHPATTLSIHDSSQRICDRLPPESCLSLYEAGYTIVYRRLEERSYDCAGLAKRLAHSTKGSTSLNLYLTPPGSRGFDTHVDRHEVAVLQAYGTKEWRIGSPTTPLTLRAGTLLRLREGVPHAAESSPNSASVHITAGYRPPTVDQYLLWLANRLRASSPARLDWQSTELPRSVLEAAQIEWKHYVETFKSQDSRD